MSESTIVFVFACVLSFLLGMGAGRTLRHHRGMLLASMIATIAIACWLMVAPLPNLRGLLVTSLLMFVIGIRFELADRRSKP